MCNPVSKPPDSHALNGICPYFTMFPLEFPLSILQKHASKRQWVLDPFCGRGTTNYASRLLNLPSIGIDASPVAVALSEAKLANASPRQIINTARKILDKSPVLIEKPKGEFWLRLYHKDVLNKICILRKSLLEDCRSDTRKALRAIILGALHGPICKTSFSYFSNQCPRTYSPKPAYAVNFWKNNGYTAPKVDILEVIEKRALRYYAELPTKIEGKIINGDSRDKAVFFKLAGYKADWIVTSPPYLGMHTYIPDQWLRLWFLGGPSSVSYSCEKQIDHSSSELFIEQLQKVWSNVREISSENANLVIRFGAINSRKEDPLNIIKKSFNGSGWRIKTIIRAGTAANGNRQALHFFSTPKIALEEFDIWASCN